MRARIWLSLAIALLAGPAGASAHSILQAVGETSGAGVRLSYSAPVEEDFVRITTLDGRPVAAFVDPADAQIVVTPGVTGAEPDLRWRVMSRDGHVTEGRINLTPNPRGNATSSRRSPLSIPSDVLAFAALLGLIGMVGVRFVVIAPAWRTGGTRPPGSGAADAWRRVLGPSLDRGIRAWWITWWCLVGAAGFGLACGVIGLLSELDSTDIGTLSGTRWGVAWVAQVAGLCIAAAVSALLFRSSRRDAPDPARQWGYGMAIPLGIAAAGISWAGHASSRTDAGIGIGLDAIHLSATGIWLGGLAALLAIVPRARRGLSDVDATRFAAAVVVRFSTVAILCVATLVVTGVYRAIAELTAFNDLGDTGYGRALLVKLIVFSVLLIGGAFNRLVLHPRLERAALGLRETDSGAGHALRISLAAEIAGAVVLLVVVGVLVNLPPP